MPDAVARLAAVAYGTELADRIRLPIGTGPGVTEKKMSGGTGIPDRRQHGDQRQHQDGASARQTPPTPAPMPQPGTPPWRPWAAAYGSASALQTWKPMTSPLRRSTAAAAYAK